METHLHRIREIRSELGDRLLILTHHYQRMEVADLGDLRGDSFELAREASIRLSAERIVFCGVHFMAEAARVLAGPHQRVWMPEPAALCPMAEMVDPGDAAAAFERIRRVQGPGGPIPVAYMNTSAATKAFCGEHGGLVCTSSNAQEAFRWAQQQGESILFLPDEFLGRNTAAALGIAAGRVARYDPRLEDGGLTDVQVAEARVLVWAGYCHVHTWFTVSQVQAARERFPGARVVVHPECPPEVVNAADAAGSTRSIVDFAKAAGPGSTVIVGTEINLVKRLARDLPDRRILPLSSSLCPNMFKTTVPKLLSLLETFDSRLEVTLDPAVVRWSRVALERMLALPRPAARR